MKQIIKKIFITIIVSTFAFNTNAQNYNNIVNHYFNNTPTHGVKIKTNLPFVNSSQMPSIKIEGYNYGSTVDVVSTINLNISWYIYNNAFYVPTASSFGGTAPNIWLSNENGKVVVYLDQKIFYQRFTISAYANGLAEKPEYFTNWTVTDEPKGGTAQVQVPYKNIFAGKVGIGVEKPTHTLDVNGDMSAGIDKNDTSIGEGNRLFFKGINNNTDFMFISKYNRDGNKTDLRVNIGDDQSGDDKFVVGNIISQQQEWRNLFVVSNNGRVGIGVENPTATLDVKGTIKAEEVKIEVTTGADYVFEKDYELQPLKKVETFIKENKHLPEIPSEKEMQENGLSLKEFQMKLLQKIEELTLYVIDQNKQIESIRKENNTLKEENNKIRKQISTAFR